MKYVTLVLTKTTGLREQRFQPEIERKKKQFQKYEFIWIKLFEYKQSMYGHWLEWQPKKHCPIFSSVCLEVQFPDRINYYSRAAQEYYLVSCFQQRFHIGFKWKCIPKIQVIYKCLNSFLVCQNIDWLY